MKYQTEDLRIKAIGDVSPPAVICEEIAISERAAKTTYETRQAISNILHGNDKRLIVIAGPCSIHDVKAAKEYADRLRLFQEKFSDDLLIVMRVYFEKPRTTVGWKGLINDPDIDGSFKINDGIRMARKLLLELNERGIPAGTEYLDLVTPQYITDLISWGAIGARTTESQVHRELASGLSCPVGFKNGTDGNTKIAVDAIHAAMQPHHFMSLKKIGNSGIFSTTGNPDCHIILRGGKQPNYDEESINRVAQELHNANLREAIMIDCSHANSNKQHDIQKKVCKKIAEQIEKGDRHIFGIMIESHLVAGRQDIIPGKNLTYGQSITDACLGWEDTVTLFEQLAQAANSRRKLIK